MSVQCIAREYVSLRLKLKALSASVLKRIYICDALTLCQQLSIHSVTPTPLQWDSRKNKKSKKTHGLELR